MSSIIFNNKKTISHLVFWFGFFALFTFFWSARYETEEAVLRSLMVTAIEASIAYLNLLVLLPLFFMKKKYFSYVIICLLLIAGSVFISGLIDPVPSAPPNQEAGRRNRDKERQALRDSLEQLRDDNNTTDSQKRSLYQQRQRMRNRPGPDFFIRMLRQSRNIFNGMLSLAVILMSTAVGMAQMAFDREKEATEFKNEKLNAEMKFLKSQINPHFLFNSLNSAYTLAYIKSDDAPEVILRLSNMLRYLIYECDADKVPVSKEITYIENYIAIQKIRLDNPDNINVSFQIDNSSLMVEPMLFIPFIENSFKHSYIENSEKGWIDILLNVNDKNIEFIVRNSLPEKEFSKDKVGGIGLENVKRRLELLYHKDHKLIVEKREKEFFVQLNISIV